MTFTTRGRDVCQAMEAHKIMEVGNLSKEEAWILFRQKVGNSVDDPSLHEIAKEVAKECKGMPIAIITVARALKFNNIQAFMGGNKKLVMAMKPNVVSAEANVCDSEARK
ncbi:hypothetical protein MTR67_046218, partial [Solanum verrucosum]